MIGFLQHPCKPDGAMCVSVSVFVFVFAFVLVSAFVSMPVAWWEMQPKSFHSTLDAV